MIILKALLPRYFAPQVSRAIFLWQLSTGCTISRCFRSCGLHCFDHTAQCHPLLFSVNWSHCFQLDCYQLVSKSSIFFSQKNNHFNVCVVVLPLFWISAQWMCYFMHRVNWNCQTNAYLVWHLGSITLVSPSSACVPPPVHCSPFLGRTSHITATPCFLSAKMQNCERTLQVVIYNTNHAWSVLSKATWWVVR